MKVVDTKLVGHDTALVTLRAADRSRLDSADARSAAVAAAGAKGLTGKIGFSGHESFAFIPKGSDAPASEADMIKPEVLAAGGAWQAVLRVKAM